MAISIEPRAPNAAASVGAASPNIMEPNTAIIIATGGARATNVIRNFSVIAGSSSDRGILGPAVGFNEQ